jgi:hypothetical protein
LGDEGEKYLIGFGPLGVVYNVEKDYVVISDRNLLENNGEGGNETFKTELGRWKAPEILSKNQSKETEKSLVFTIGMMCFTLIMGENPFQENSTEIATQRIVMSETPDLERLERKKCRYVKIMKECWCYEPLERMNLMELKMKGMDDYYEDVNNDEDDGRDEEGYGN